MGYDVSAHPVDVELIQNRVLPYVRGKGDLSDLVETAVRLAQVRFRANAWGLGLLNLSHAESDAKRQKPEKKPAAKSPTRKKPAAKKWLVPDTFNSDLHVWGRPFFITVPSDRVPEAIDRYLAATPRQVDRIAEEMLRELNPDLVGKVKPDTGGKLPDRKTLAAGVLRALDFYRAAYPKLAKNETIELPNGQQSPARELFLHSFPLDVITFASQFLPGWMSRGYVWFTAFIERAYMDAGKLVGSAAPLFEPLLKGVKGFRQAFEPTIIENYTLGGYVRPKNVPAFRKWMEEGLEDMVEACVDEDWDEPSTRVELQKILEPLREAERRGMGFIEAAEVYSGIMGVMN
jgi:hypothetical protein